MDNHLQRNFQFSNAPAVRQLHEQAMVLWQQRRQPPAPTRIEALTDQQQHLLRQTATPDSVKKQVALRARQYGLTKPTLHIKFDNTEAGEICEICRILLNKNDRHYHFSANKRYISNVTTGLVKSTGGYIDCFPCQILHPPTE